MKNLEKIPFSFAECIFLVCKHLLSSAYVYTVRPKVREKENLHGPKAQICIAFLWLACVFLAIVLKILHVGLFSFS